MRRLAWLIAFTGCNAGGLGGDAVRPDLAGSITYPPEPDLLVRATCTDGVQNQDETDVDCGGSCAPCAEMQACATDSDCASGNCQLMRCRVADRCADGLRDGEESDVDCGGSQCPACANGRPCGMGNDCASRHCRAGSCIVPPATRLGFAAPAYYPLDDAYGQPAIGDFDNDGKLDVAVMASGGLAVLPGHGDGTLGMPQTYPMDGSDLATADFDRDGHADIASTAWPNYMGEVVVRFGQAKGFAPPIVLMAGNQVAGPVIADVNGDGRLDLVTQIQGLALPGQVFLGGANRKFTAGPTFQRGGNAPSSLAAGDLDGDGKADVLVGRTDAGPIVYRGGAAGALTVLWAPAKEGNGGAFGLALGHFDGDSRLDVALSANNTYCFPGDGKGGFGAPVMGSTVSGFWDVTADFNSDGWDDLVMSDPESHHSMTKLGLDVVLGKNDGTFEAPLELDVDGHSRGVAVGDLNHDGRPDIVVASGEAYYPDHGIKVFLNTTK